MSSIREHGANLLRSWTLSDKLSYHGQDIEVSKNNIFVAIIGK